MSHNIRTQEQGGTILRILFLTVALIVLFRFFGFDFRGFLASEWLEQVWNNTKAFIGI